MPIFSDLSLYYSGASLPSPHLYASPRYNVYSGPSRPLPARIGAYSPLLPTISESSSLSPVFPRRTAATLARISSPRALAYQPPRPVRINTADIDVSAPRRYSRPERQGTIRRNRPLVRLHTKKASREKTRGEQLVEKFLIKEKPAPKDEPRRPPLKEMEVLDCILAEEQTATAEDSQSRRSSVVDARLLDSCGDVEAKDAPKKKRKKKAKSGDLEESMSEAEDAGEKTTLKRRNTVKHIRRVSLDLLSESPLVHRPAASAVEESINKPATQTAVLHENVSLVDSERKDVTPPGVSETVPQSAKQPKHKISFEVSVDNHDDIILKSKRLPFRIIVDDVKVEDIQSSSSKVKPKKHRYKITVEDAPCDLRKSVKQLKRFLTSKKVKDSFIDIIPVSGNLDENVPLENIAAHSFHDDRMKSNLAVIKETVTDEVRAMDSFPVTENKTDMIVTKEDSKSFTSDSQKPYNVEKITIPSLQGVSGQILCKSPDNLSIPPDKGQEIFPGINTEKTCEKSFTNIHEENKELLRTSERSNLLTPIKSKKELLSANVKKEECIFPKSNNKAPVVKKLQKVDISSKFPMNKNVNLNYSVISHGVKEGKQTAVTKNILNHQSSSSELPHQHWQSVSEHASSGSASEMNNITNARTDGEGGGDNSSADSTVDFWALLKSPSVTEVVESGRTVLRYKRSLSSTLSDHKEETGADATDESVPENKKHQFSVKKGKKANSNYESPSERVNREGKHKSDPSAIEIGTRKDVQNIPFISASKSSDDSLSSGKIIRKHATADLQSIVKTAAQLPTIISNPSTSNKTTLEKLTNNKGSKGSEESEFSISDTSIYTKTQDTSMPEKSSKLKQMYEDLNNTLRAGKSLSINQEEENKNFLEMKKSLSQIAEMGIIVPSLLDDNLTTTSSETTRTKPSNDLKDKLKPAKPQKSRSCDDKFPETLDSLLDNDKAVGLTEYKGLQKCNIMADTKSITKDIIDKRTEPEPRIMQPSKEEVNIQLKSPTKMSSFWGEEETIRRESQKHFSTGENILEHSSEVSNEKKGDEASSKQETENKMGSEKSLTEVCQECLEKSTILSSDVPFTISLHEHTATSGKSGKETQKPISQNYGILNSSVGVIKKVSKKENESTTNKISHEQISGNTAQEPRMPANTREPNTSTENKKVESVKREAELNGKTKDKSAVAKTLKSEMKSEQPSTKTKATRATGSSKVVAENSVVATVSSVVVADNSLIPEDNSLAAGDSSVVVVDKSVVAAGKLVVAAKSAVPSGKSAVPSGKSAVPSGKSGVAAGKLVAAADKSGIAAGESAVAASKSAVSARKSAVAADESVVAADKPVVSADNLATESGGSVVGSSAAREDSEAGGERETMAAAADQKNSKPAEGGGKEEEGSSSEDEADEDEDTLTEDSEEEGEGSGSSEQRCSSSSDDSGFDSRPSSENKHDCDVNCHRKCEKLMPHLCGVNQKLIVEALSSVKKGSSSESSGSREPGSPTTSLVNSPDLRLDSCYDEARGRTPRSSSGRVTPPATTIPRFRKYTIDDFHFLKVLGKGSYGKVLLAELKNTECYYAVKCLKKDVVLEDDDVECTLIERKVLALGTKHPYLCHLFATFQTESHLFFVMEYLNGGDLMFHIQQGGRFHEPRARFYAAEIVSGLRFLHNKGIVYRDLKLDNVLLDFDGHIRIADFGMCKLQIFLDRTADTFCGTPDYMAPEVIKGQKYNQCVDWWSFGVLMYEMLVGQSPFSGCDEDDLFWSICNEQPQFPRHLSKEASSMLAMLLEKDSSKRLGTPQCDSGDVIDQPFFRPVDWAALERRELEPPFKPRVKHPLDVQYFDKTFTNERAKITPVDRSILQSMDQTQFQGFSYTNPYATE